MARRIPPHVTVLFPFASPFAIDTTLEAELAGHFAVLPAFEASLTRVSRFDGTLWLAPEPRERFVELITTTCARFPAYQPYGGEFAEPEPHLSIATIDAPEDEEATMNAANEELESRLPFHFAVNAVALYVEQEDGTWREAASFPLA